MTLKEYCLKLIDEIPHEVYVIALIIFCVGIILTLFAKGLKKGLRWSVALLLLEYVFLVFGSTVFFRQARTAREFNFSPFWSYDAIYSGKEPELFSENIMNVVVFIPVGLLFGSQIKPGRKGWLIAFLLGVGISILIEVSQLVLKRGFSELDDVMHNTLGCMIGYGIYRLIYMCVNSKTKRIYG